ncbi:MAG: helix-turn-helix domain-containing protein [Clostridia bacterium]|nr:helix-turn-helix domain-containing protein [Clostridia bacterium]
MIDRKAINATELARYLGVGRNRAYQLIHMEGFPAVKISPRRIVIPLEALERWLEERVKGGQVTDV